MYRSDMVRSGFLHQNGYPFVHEFSVTADSSLAEFERAVVGHPIFALESVG